MNKETARFISEILIDAVDSAIIKPSKVIEGFKEINNARLKTFLNGKAFEYNGEKNEMLTAVLATNFKVASRKKQDEYWLLAGKYVIVSGLDSIEDAQIFCCDNGLILEK